MKYILQQSFGVGVQIRQKTVVVYTFIR